MEDGTPGPGSSSPIVVGQRIFLTCYTGFGVPGRSDGDMEQLKRHVVCLNRTDGRILWTKVIAPKLPESLKVRAHGYAASTPAADNERLIVFFGKSGVFAFDHAGKQLWQADVGSEVHEWGSAASPVLDQDLVFINACVESESLVALNARTGKEVWRAKGIMESWSTPLVVKTEGGTTELVLPINGKILGFDPASGELLWSCDTGIGSYMVPSLVAHDGIVYCIGGRSGGALAVRAGGRGDVTQSHRLWTSRKHSNVSSPVFHDGHLYWMHDSLGIAYCMEGKTGKIVYEKRVKEGETIYASAVLADERLYYIFREGGGSCVLAARPEFQELARNERLDTWNINFDGGIVPHQGQLLLRSDRFVYCIGNR